MGLLLILAVAALVGATSAQIGAEHCEWDNLGGREIHTDWYPCVQPRFAGQGDCDWPGYYWSFTNNGNSDVLDEGSVMCVDGWTQTSPSTSPTMQCDSANNNNIVSLSGCTKPDATPSASSAGSDNWGYGSLLEFTNTCYDTGGRMLHNNGVCDEPMGDDGNSYCMENGGPDNDCCAIVETAGCSAGATWANRGNPATPCATGTDENGNSWEAHPTICLVDGYTAGGGDGTCAAGRDCSDCGTCPGYPGFQAAVAAAAAMLLVIVCCLGAIFIGELIGIKCCIDSKKQALGPGTQVSAMAWISCIGLWFFGFTIIMWIPFVIDSCYEVPAQPNVMIQMQPGFAQQPVMAQGQPAMAVATAVPMQGQPVMAVATAMPAKAVTNP